MYETWFSLTKRPFQAAPQAVSYFPNDAFESACEGLWRCIQRNAGPGVVIGEHGTGKSLMTLLMANQFQANWSVVQISAPSIQSRKELIQTILFELGLPYVSSDEGELRLSLLDYLTSAHQRHEGTLLIIDDAHDLSVEMLEQVASLSGLVREGRWCFDVILLGTTELDEKLVDPALTSLNQRIAARYYLRCWPAHVTANYIRHQLGQAGGDTNALFEAAALQQVHDLTRGVPRLVNQLCDHTLILAAAGEIRQIAAEMVREAWSDLQKLPKQDSAQVISSPATQDDPIVEFGSLEDESTTPDEAYPPQVGFTESEAAFEPHEMILSDDPTPETDDLQVVVQPALSAVARNDHDESPMDIWRKVFEKPPAHYDQLSDPVSLIAEGEDSASRMLDEIELRLIEANADFDRRSAMPHASRSVHSDPCPANPFCESFAEEEIVVSRNMLPQVDWMNRQPIVKTARGTELIDALKLIEFGENFNDACWDSYPAEATPANESVQSEEPMWPQTPMEDARAPELPTSRQTVELATAATTIGSAEALDLQTAHATGDLEPSHDAVEDRHPTLDSLSVGIEMESTVCVAPNYAANQDETPQRLGYAPEFPDGGMSALVLARHDHAVPTSPDYGLSDQPSEDIPSDETRPTHAHHTDRAAGHYSPRRTANETSSARPTRERKFSRLFSNLKRQ